ARCCGSGSIYPADIRRRSQPPVPNSKARDSSPLLYDGRRKCLSRIELSSSSRACPSPTHRSIRLCSSGLRRCRLGCGAPPKTSWRAGFIPRGALAPLGRGQNRPPSNWSSSHLVARRAMRTGPWPARVPWTRLRKADGGLGQVSVIWLYVGISPGEMAEVGECALLSYLRSPDECPQWLPDNRCVPIRDTRPAPHQARR